MAYDVNDRWGFNVWHEDYAAAVRTIAAEDGYPVVDVYQAYQDMLEPPYLTFIRGGGWEVVDIVVLYELARLEEEVGDPSAAREHYREYLEQWGNADMPVVNVPDARKRLEALEAKL